MPAAVALALRWQANLLRQLRALGLLKIEAVRAHLATLGAEVDASTIARWAEGNRTAPLGLLPALLEHCGAREVLQAIADDYALEVVSRDLPSRRQADLGGEVLDLVSVVGELAGRARAALTDGQIDEEERTELLRILDSAANELRDVRAALTPTTPTRSAR